MSTILAFIAGIGLYLLLILTIIRFFAVAAGREPGAGDDGETVSVRGGEDRFHDERNGL